jgi:hypothetical protein
MPERDPERTSTSGHLRLAMLQEIYDDAINVAGLVWPTPGLALGSLFERGVLALEAGSGLPPLDGHANRDLLGPLNEAREDLYLVQAEYGLTRHAAFRTTEQAGELEAFWLTLADRHLEIRAQIVERRREEERLKRELSTLGGVTTPLPEHEDLPTSDPNRSRKSRGMFSRLFEGASVIEVEIDAAPPLVRLADSIAEARGWANEWGEHARLLVLLYGVSRAERDREAEGIDADADDAVREALGTVRARLMHLEGRHSTMRRRLFELRHNNRILQWRITALEVEARGMCTRLEQFTDDRDRLLREIEARRELRASLPEPPHQPQPELERGWRGRIARLFGSAD